MHDLASSAQIKRLLVRAPESDYEILLGNSLLGQVGMLAAEVQLGRKVVVASDSNVASLYGAKVLASLSQASYDAHLVQMPAGEEHKTWASVDLFIEGFLD